MTWKIHLTIVINFISAKDAEEGCEMHSSSIKVTSYNDANDEPFESICSKYHGNLKKIMRKSDFIFDSVQLMYYQCHKVNFTSGNSYIDSPGCLKKKKATINPKNKDDKCVQYAATVASNYDKVKWSAEIVSNIKSFIKRYNWKGINYPSKLDDWKMVEKKNSTIALNILYTKEKEICSAYISKINLNCEKQVILLMIPNEEEDGVIKH